MNKKEATAEQLLQNPYNFSNPVKKLENLSGRKTELEQIRTSLSNKEMSLAIIGKRGIGKTSILNATSDIAKQLGFTSVAMSLDDSVVVDEYVFFRELYIALFSCLEEKNLVTEKEKGQFRNIIDASGNQDEAFFLKFPHTYLNHCIKKIDVPIPRQYILDDLTVIQKKIATQIIVLVDECDVLANNKSILQTLRNILQKIEGFTFILTGTDKLLDELSEVFAPAARQFKRIDIESFKNPKQTIELIYNPLKSLEDIRRPSWQTLHDLHMIAEGNPYELKVLCHYLWDANSRTKKRKEFKLNTKIFLLAANQVKALYPDHQKFIELLNNLSADDLGTVVSLVNNELLTLREKSLLETLFTTQYTETFIKNLEEKYKIDSKNYTDILEVNENERVAFKGENFEKVYLKYLAQSKFKDKKIRWGNFKLPFAIFEKLVNNISSFLNTETSNNLITNVTFSDLTPSDKVENVYFDENFKKSYNFFNSPASKLPESTAELDQREAFIKAYIKFDGKPQYHFIYFKISFKEKNYYGSLVIENRFAIEKLNEHIKTYDDQYLQNSIIIKAETHSTPELSVEKIFEKIKFLEGQKEDQRTLYQLVDSVGVDFAIEDKEYKKSKFIFEQLKLHYEPTFELYNNLGFVCLKLGELDSAKENLDNAHGYIDKKDKGQIFLSLYNRASLNIYQNDLDAAKENILKIKKMHSIVNNEEEEGSHYLFTFFLGNIESADNLNSFNQFNFRVAILLMETYIDFQATGKDIKKIESKLLEPFNEFNTDEVYLKGICAFYKTINDVLNTEKYEEVLEKVISQSE